tara:strand:+ start:905 stop:1114 length:210 start_codon:yes stop_codon:yes gene_type:complete
MKKISHLTYEANIKKFHEYLEAKHKMPFWEIQIKNISDQDLQKWREIENMRNVKIGFSFGDNVKRDIRG